MLFSGLIKPVPAYSSNEVINAQKRWSSIYTQIIYRALIDKLINYLLTTFKITFDTLSTTSTFNFIMLMVVSFFCFLKANINQCVFQ